MQSIITVLYVAVAWYFCVASLTPINGPSFEKTKTTYKFNKRHRNDYPRGLCFIIGVEHFKQNDPKKPKLSDIKVMLKLGVSPNYEFQPEFYDKIGGLGVMDNSRSLKQWPLPGENGLLLELRQVNLKDNE